jgi:hypothetical protein
MGMREEGYKMIPDKFEHHILIADTQKNKTWLADLDRRMNDMGEQGWELIQVLHSMQNVLAFMKRRIGR